MRNAPSVHVSANVRRRRYEAGFRISASRSAKIGPNGRHGRIADLPWPTSAFGRKRTDRFRRSTVKADARVALRLGRTLGDPDGFRQGGHLRGCPKETGTQVKTNAEVSPPSEDALFSVSTDLRDTDTWSDAAICPACDAPVWGRWPLGALAGLVLRSVNAGARVKRYRGP